ncbi:RDD family protein [Gracilimonas mengyeensis]|uniref:Uncharacterized membrane protein YckC, RDD family n=1 Tax=Gracilimonas mengyeensis TaxID=1302730 RepID=A0A521FJC5_9BACT|nr:RDD family protein [Gracilimonas mengyeensis]SMO96307.1 Uncharacterized membrane protein YckC, RDD family [Gracilimonas mengyeensis]
MVGVETSQHVQLSYEPAGVGDRVLAYLLDGFFMGVYFFVVFWIWGYWYSLGSDPADLSLSWVFYVVIVLPLMLYHLVSEVLWKGYSPGKKIVGIRVVKVDGSRADLSGYLIRWLFRLVEISMTSGVIAFVAVIMNGKGQRLGDMVGKTCVIKERKKAKLEDTLFKDVSEGYEPVFPQVTELNDKDIRVIQDVLDARSHYEYDTWFKMLKRTRQKLEARLGVQDHGMRTDVFLETIIKDYNAIHGSVK